MRSISEPSSSLIVILVLGAVLSLGVVGCAPEKPDASPPGPTGKQSAAAAEANESRESNAEKPQAAEQPGVEDGPKLAVIQKDATVNWSDESGRRRMSARAREIGWNEASLKGVALDFSAKLYENGKLTASISAPKAVIDTKDQTVTATGGVSMKSLERETSLTALWVKWFARKHKIIGNGGVKIESPTWKAEGAAFEADTGLENYRIMDSAKGLGL